MKRFYMSLQRRKDLITLLLITAPLVLVSLNLLLSFLPSLRVLAYIVLSLYCILFSFVTCLKVSGNK